MKLLLDENLPKKLKSDFSEHEIFTVSDKGWNGKKNGELLSPMLNENFDALLTFDQNLEHQQNFEKYPITVFVLIAENNTYAVLSQMIENIKTELRDTLISGVVKVKNKNDVQKTFEHRFYFFQSFDTRNLNSGFISPRLRTIY